MTADRAIKEPCRVATTANITLSGLQTIDGVAVAAGDRVLVKNQSSAVNNGLYDAASGAWSRSTDFDGGGEVVGGTEVLVTSGSTQAGNFYRVAGAGPITIGSSAINFELAIEADAVSFLQAGTGAVIRTAQEKLREQWVSVKDFGAIGSGSVDDVAAINLAIAALNPGQTLYFPDGDYRVSVTDGVEKALTPIPVRCNVYMEGGAWLKPVDTADVLTFFTPLGDNILQVNIDGDEYPSSGGVRGSWGNRVTGIRCYESATFGLDADNVVVINSEIKNVRFGIRADGAKNWRILGSKIHRTQLSGILFGYFLDQDCLHNIVANSVFEDHGDTAVGFFQIDGEDPGYCAFNLVANCTAKNTNQGSNSDPGGAGFAFDVEVGDPDFQQNISFVNLVVEQEEISGATLQRGAATMGGVRNGLIMGVVAKSYSKPGDDVGINMRECIGGLIDDYSLMGFGGPAIDTDGCDGLVVGGNGTIIDCGGGAGNTPAIRGSLQYDTRNVTIHVPKIVTTTAQAFRSGEAAVAFLCPIGATTVIENIRIIGGTAENPTDVGVAVLPYSGAVSRNIEISGIALTGSSGGGTYFNTAGIQVRYCDNVKISDVALDPQGGTLLHGLYVRDCNEVEVDGVDVLGGTITYLFDFTNSTGVRVDNQRTFAGATITNAVLSGGNGTLTRWGEHIDAYPLPNAANDAAAAALTPPVPVGAPYRNGSVRMVRVS